MPERGKLYVVSARDNVATALEDLPAGPAQVLGAAAQTELHVRTALRQGHKAALRDIAAGADVIKYGAVIGRATADIRTGEWVHVHNIASRYDTRSASAIDPRTGKVLDTHYE